MQYIKSVDIVNTQSQLEQIYSIARFRNRRYTNMNVVMEILKTILMFNRLRV